MSTPEALRTWITSTFPHIKPPSEETLEALSNSTTRPLWHFLTTRALSTANARAARAAIALDGEHYTPAEEPFQKFLRELHTEIDALEQEIVSLREGGHGADVPVGDVVNAALDTRTLAIREFVQEMRTPESRSGELDGLLEEIGDAVTEDSLDAVESFTMGIGQGALLGVLKRHLSDAEKRVVPVDIISAGVDTETYARDVVLRAFKDVIYCRGEHLRGMERLHELAGGVGEEARGRVLVAQIEGERAVLAFAKEREGIGGGGKGVLKDVSGVENACGRLVEGNLRMLEEVREVFEGSEEFWRGMWRDVGAGVESAVTMVEAVERGSENTENGVLERVCECETRRWEIGRVEERWRELGRGLGERAAVAEETRERVLARVDVGIVEKAVAAAVQSREVDAVRVRNELVAFVRQPGKGAAPWLGV